MLRCYDTQVVSHVGIKIENIDTEGELVEWGFEGFGTAICHKLRVSQVSVVGQNRA